MRGMFAFAIWDGRKEELFLARDRLGQKPLYYYINQNKFVFASEIKAIIEDPTIPREANPVALNHFLTYQYIPAPLTAFKGIKKLPQASYLIIKPGGKQILKAYWQLSFRENLKLPFEEYKSELRRLLFESTKLRMISDVPLGAFLSGGIDSSIIVGIMSRLSDQPVKTFTIGFEEKDYNEAHFAKIIADKFKTEHHELYVRPNAIEILPELIWHYDQPYADVSALPSYYVARETSKFVKVVLNGDGGD